MENNKKKYIWECNGDNSFYNAISDRTFDSKGECYNDMRDAALEKMKWNTQYREDFDGQSDENGVFTPFEDEDNYIEYKVLFYPHKIVHHSFSGTYTYEIKEKIKDIFVGAEFGDRFITMSGTKAIFVSRNDSAVWMLIDGQNHVTKYKVDGSNDDGDTDLNIKEKI